MDIMTKELKQEVVTCAQKNRLGFYQWGNHLPNGSIDYKQLDGNTLGVQIYIPDNSGYIAYETVKSELEAIFSNYEICIEKETVLDAKKGWFRELHFMRLAAYQEKKLKETEEEMKKQSAAHIEHQYNAPVSVGRDMNTGRDAHIDNTTNESNDKKWFQKEVVKMLFSFIGGVAATIVAQLILKALGIL